MVKYAGEGADDEDSRKRYEAAMERFKKENPMYICDMCQIPYPEVCMMRITPDKLCKACDIRRGLGIK